MPLLGYHQDTFAVFLCKYWKDTVIYTAETQRIIFTLMFKYFEICIGHQRHPYHKLILAFHVKSTRTWINGKRKTNMCWKVDIYTYIYYIDCGWTQIFLEHTLLWLLCRWYWILLAPTWFRNLEPSGRRRALTFIVWKVADKITIDF